VLAGQPGREGDRHLGGVAGAVRSANGTYTEQIRGLTTGNLIFTPTNTARLTIDDVSVKKIGAWTQPHIADADLTNVHTRFNTLLNALEAYGLLAAS